MDTNGADGLSVLVWLIAIAGSLVLRWCSSTEEHLVEHLKSYRRVKSRVDAAYTCAPTGEDRVLVGIHRSV